MQGSLRGNAGPRYRHTAEEGVPYETIAVDKLTPIIGAEIDGIDLAQPLSNRQQDELHRALAENSVIFFRDQHITPDQHVAFGRLFGALKGFTSIPPGVDLTEPADPEWGKVYEDRSPDGAKRNPG